MEGIVFYEMLFDRFHGLPIEEAKKYVLEAAALEGAPAEQAIREYLLARGLANAQELNGMPVSDEKTQVVSLILQAGGKVELARDDNQVVYRIKTETGEHEAPSEGKGKRQRYSYLHRGKPVTQPLARFVRNTYPKSKAAEILAKPGKSAKSVVGAWQAIQRDSRLRAHFERKPGGRKRQVKRAA